MHHRGAGGGACAKFGDSLASSAHNDLICTHFVNETEIYDEDEEPTGYEIKSRKKKCTDDKPIHFATAILQWSKYLFQK